MGAFCEALQESGHGFLADHLRMELSLSESGRLSSTEERSNIQNYLNEMEAFLPARQNKEELVKYLQKKLKQFQGQVVWTLESVDNAKGIAAKMGQIEESMRHKDAVALKKANIIQLQEEVQAATEGVEARANTLKQTAATLYRMQKKQEEEIKIQAKYRQANENSFKRLSKRQQDQDSIMSEMFYRMDTYTKDVLRRLEERNSEEKEKLQKDLETVPDTASYFEKSKVLLNIILERAWKLENIEHEYEELVGEADQVLAQIGRKSHRRMSLKTGVRDYVVEVNLQMMDMKKDYQRILADIERFINTRAELEAHIEHLKSVTADADFLSRTFDENIRIIAELEAVVAGLVAGSHRNSVTKRHSKFVGDPRYSLMVEPTYQVKRSSITLDDIDFEPRRRSVTLYPLVNAGTQNERRMSESRKKPRKNTISSQEGEDDELTSNPGPDALANMGENGKLRGRGSVLYPRPQWRKDSINQDGIDYVEQEEI